MEKTGSVCRTYEEAVRYLASLPPFLPGHAVPGEDLFCLDAVAELVRRLGHPERQLRCVHITGTNGKGSTSTYLADILAEAGIKTGLYTSPAVSCIRERIRIGERMISEAEFAELARRVAAESEAMKAEGAGYPSEFEQVTAGAFSYFAEKKCDIAVLEVGLGGRVDATNVIPAPLLAVFTPVSRDHTEILGGTLRAIAREKAGIIKPGCAVLTGPQDEEVMEVLRGAAERAGAPLFVAEMPEELRMGEEPPDRESDMPPVRTGQRFLLCGRAYFTRMCGSYQPENAALAIRAAELLRDFGYGIPEEAVAAGIAKTQLPGRFEILRRKPYLVADGSHNPAGIRALTETLLKVLPGRRVHLIAGVLADKDYSGMVSEMAPLAASVRTITPASPRALDAEELAVCFRNCGVSAEVCPSAEAAVSAALREADPEDVICAFGSFFTAAAVRENVTQHGGYV